MTALSKSEHKFPNDHIFNRLLHLAKTRQEVIIRGPHDFKANYTHLLSDVLRLRGALRDSLPPSALNEHGLICEESTYICVLVMSGYDFIIAFLAILSLGCACIPLPSGALPEEANYFLEKSNSNYLLVGSDRTQQASKIKQYTKESGGRDIITIPIDPAKECPNAQLDIQIDDQAFLSPERAALVICTSGTTGTPKCVVLPRCRFHFDVIAEPGLACINYRPPQWIGGARSLIQPLLTGKLLIILPNRPTTDLFWDCIRERTITNLIITPTMLGKLKNYFEEHIAHLPKEEIVEYIDGINHLKLVSCSSAMIASTVLNFWRHLRGDFPFQNAYGSTESGTVLMTQTTSMQKHSVGTAASGVSVKLSEGDHGEILVKSPSMFLHYLGDADATKASFDDEGFFKTGDLAHLESGEYIFDGRAKTDWILFYDYRISILELEDNLMGLPYITEAYVLAAPHHEARELPAAIVRLTDTNKSMDNSEITLQRIRDDLYATTAAYKLPALLRVLQNGEVIPRSPTDKPIKRGLLKLYFDISTFVPPDYSVPGVEYWGNRLDQVESKTRPWDWCGLQRGD